MTDPGYAKARARLSPEALKALQAIGDMSGPMDDPFGDGVTLDHIKAIDAAARTLRDLARTKALTAPPART